MKLLEAKGVSKYFGGLKAVEDVSFSVEKGQIYGIIGPNGAGKTTFFNMCAGAFPLTKGEIRLDGEDITALSAAKKARSGIARTFQSIQLFKNMTVLENVIVGLHMHTSANLFDAIVRSGRYIREERECRQRADALLDRLELREFRDTLAKNLPYAMQRKVEIARALASNPKLLLLDEPAAGMNPNETRALSDFIKSVNAEGYTVIVIEHDIKFIMGLCDRIMVLNYGRRICEGLPEEVKNDTRVIEAYFGRGRTAKGGMAEC